MGAMTPAAALLAGGAISGIGSLGSGLLSSSSASKNNNTALNFNKWSQLQAQQFQTQMYEQQRYDQENFYKKYQSPQAIAKALQQLGVNPASAFSGSTGIGTSPASMPSVPSTPALSSPALENTGTAFSKSIEAIGSAMSNILASGAQSEQSIEMVHTFNERMNSLILQNSGQQLMNIKAQWDIFASQAKLPYEVQSMVLKAYADYYAGRYSDSLAKLNDLNYYIEDKCKDLTIEQKQQAVTLLGKQILVATEDAKLRKEQQKTERTQQALNVAAKNESVSRTTGLDFDNSIKRIDSENAAATASQKLAAMREEYMRNSSLSRKERVEAEVEFEKLDKILKMYREHSNKAALDAALDNFNDKFPIIGGIIKALK